MFQNRQNFKFKVHNIDSKIIYQLFCCEYNFATKIMKEQSKALLED